MKKQIALPLAFVALIIVVIAAITFMLIYNGMVMARENIKESKAQIETVYQRKLDLIPNLVETVKAYAGHERQTLVDVAQARSRAQEVLKTVGTAKSLSKEQLAKLASSQSELTRVLTTLFALVEKYPDLKASAHFLALQDQLEGAENRIYVARQRYNSSVRDYNTKIAVFPGNMIALIFEFERVDDYFEATEIAQKPMEVRF